MQGILSIFLFLNISFFIKQVLDYYDCSTTVVYIHEILYLEILVIFVCLFAYLTYILW